MFFKTLELISIWTIPVMLCLIPIWALYKKVPLYETFIKGARSGVGVGLRIIPYLVAIFVAIGMFKASGAIKMMANIFSPVLNLINMPAEVLPLAIIRPLSGSGALGITAEIASQHGGDSYLARLAAVMTGSSETTLYVIAVYFGSVGITKVRHAIVAGLIADVAGMLAALFICNMIFL